MTTPVTYSASRPVPLAEVTRFDWETDVAVVGFGAAGACAAIEAVDTGARVMLFEAGAHGGGSIALEGGGGEIYVGGGGGSPQQRAAGFDDRTEDFEHYLMLAGGPNADPVKVRLYAEGALAHFAWLGRQGVEYSDSYVPDRGLMPLDDECLSWTGSEEAWPFAQAARPAPRGHKPRHGGWNSGRYLMDVLEARVRALGVDVHCNTRALALIADEAHHVHGLVVGSGDATRCIRARGGVVLCTGGFVHNRTMLQRHAPRLLRADRPIGALDDGSGIRLGIGMGAATVNMHESFATIPWYPPGSLVKGILVNERGQRFINEDCYHGRIAQFILDQLGDRIWLLQDSETYAPGLLHESARITVAARNDSWQRIERELGLPEGTLSTTVATYNAHAARGEDPLFHKAQPWLKPLDRPPFTVLDCSVDRVQCSVFTLGGLDTRADGEVLTEDGEPIPGLYAAGRASCGLPRWGKGYSSGMSIADCTFFGRRAGRQAARRAGSKAQHAV